MTENQKHRLEYSSDSSPQRPLKIGKTTDEVLGSDTEEAEAMNRKPGIQRYLVAVEYIGTRFSGSQKQPNCRTVVGVLEVLANFSLHCISFLSRKHFEMGHSFFASLRNGLILLSFTTLGALGALFTWFRCFENLLPKDSEDELFQVL